MVMCHALLTPADISEQTESIRAKVLMSQLRLVQNGGIWSAEHISPTSWFQQLCKGYLINYFKDGINFSMFSNLYQ